MSESASLITLHGAVEAHAAQRPNHYALRMRERWMTYGEYNAYANTFAAQLHAAAPKGSFVVVLTNDNIDGVIALTVVSKAGCCRVVLDTRMPTPAKEAILQQVNVGAWLTDRANEETAKSLSAGKPVIVIDYASAEGTPENLALDVSLDDALILGFTSGSSGVPKAVRWTQGHVANLITQSSQVQGDDICTLGFGLIASNAGGYHFMGALYNGITADWLDLTRETPESLFRWIADNGVSYCFMIPSLARTIFSTVLEEPIKTIKRLDLGTEPLLAADLDMLKRSTVPGTMFINFYAATEIGAIARFVATHDTVVDGALVPIGKPIGDINVIICDADLNPLPSGEIGEMVVRNKRDMGGYWNAPEQTNEKFVRDPLDPAYTLYRTGDMGKFLPDGNLVHLGRNDSMVKIRGFRVELLPIENALRQHPDVVHAAIKVFTDNGMNRIVGYVVPRTGVMLSVPQLRDFLAQTLPDFMIPAQFVVLDALPRLLGGKVNMAELPVPVSESSVSIMSDLTLTETRLLPLLQKVLPVKQFGRDDHFFDLGGDSLGVMRLIVELNTHFNTTVTPAVIYEHPTLAKLGAYIDRGSPILSPLVPLNPYGTKPMLIGIPGHNGYAMHFRQLCGILGHDYPLYAFQHPRYDIRVPKFQSPEALARHYIEQIERTLPSTQFYLIGASVGGQIAFEMAQQLTAAGKPPLGVILLDTYFAYTEAVKEITEQSRIKQMRKAAFRLRRNLTKQITGTEKDKANLRVRDEIEALISPYQPKPYSGKIIFFSSRLDKNTDEALSGWQSIARGEFVRIDMNAEHEILVAPHVTETARQLRGILTT